MSRRYTNPPVIEAVCEFRLSKDTPWDLTIPGLMYERIKGEFPHREQRLFQEVKITKGAQEVQQQTSTNERILFFADDKKSFVQVGTHFLSINRLVPYSSWVSLKSKIEKAFHALSKTVEIKGLERIGLRYVNRIEVPGPTVKLEDLFEFRPFLGSRLPQNMKESIVGCVWPFHDERDACKVQLTNAVPKEAGNVAFLLDLDYFLTRPRGVSPDQALEWVEDAHQEVEDLFEGCITDQLREIFGEVK